MKKKTAPTVEISTFMSGSCGAPGRTRTGDLRITNALVDEP